MGGSYVIAFLLFLYPTTLNSSGKEYKYKGQPKWSWQQNSLKNKIKKFMLLVG